MILVKYATALPAALFFMDGSDGTDPVLPHNFPKRHQADGRCKITPYGDNIFSIQQPRYKVGTCQEQAHEPDARIRGKQGERQQQQQSKVCRYTSGLIKKSQRRIVYDAAQWFREHCKIAGRIRKRWP